MSVIPQKCDNDYAGLTDHPTPTTCSACGGTFCEPCREAISGKSDRCPNCNGYVGADPSCRLVGGCGR